LYFEGTKAALSRNGGAVINGYLAKEAYLCEVAWRSKLLKLTSMKKVNEASVSGYQPYATMTSLDNLIAIIDSRGAK